MFNKKEYARNYMRIWREKHPNSHRSYYTPAYGRQQTLKQDHKMTQIEYDAILANQKGLCAICETPQHELKRLFAVDHDHETGKIRGLLCFSCNIALGHFHDSPKILADAINYINRSK